MNAFKINDIKQFMSKLLIKETFDSLYLSEATISTGNTFQIDGAINKEFYTAEELQELPQTDYALWSSIKPMIFNLIKGNRTPISMKIVFVLSNETIQTILQNGASSLSLDNINGAFINIKYSDNILTIVTGLSLNIFTLDKTLDNAVDAWLKNFLTTSEINYEEL